MQIQFDGYKFNIDFSQATPLVEYVYDSQKEPGSGLNALIGYWQRGFGKLSAAEVIGHTEKKIFFGDGNYIVFDPVSLKNLPDAHPHASQFIQKITGKLPNEDVWWISVATEREHFYIPHTTLLQIKELIINNVVVIDGFRYYLDTERKCFSSDQQQKLLCGGPPMFLNSIPHFDIPLTVDFRPAFLAQQDIYHAISAFPYRDQLAPEIVAYRKAFEKKNGRPLANEDPIWLIGSGPGPKEHILVPYSSIVKIIQTLSPLKKH